MVTEKVLGGCSVAPGKFLQVAVRFLGYFFASFTKVLGKLLKVVVTLEGGFGNVSSKRLGILEGNFQKKKKQQQSNPKTFP